MGILYHDILKIQLREVIILLGETALENHLGIDTRQMITPFISRKPRRSYSD